MSPKSLFDDAVMGFCFLLAMLILFAGLLWAQLGV
jgi:hypothetical protein